MTILPFSSPILRYMIFFGYSFESVALKLLNKLLIIYKLL